MKLAFWRKAKTTEKALSSLNDRGRWTKIFDWYPGAFQQDNLPEVTEQRAFHAVFSCITLIAGDIGKLRWRLMEKKDDIWEESHSPAFSPVLKKPNNYQNHIQFKEWWITSKLSSGNTYALKQRDGRGIVTGLWLMDPAAVTPLVSEEGEIFYQLQQDTLSGLQSEVVVPAREIIHDRMNCIFHPLVGLSPIYACGLAATQGLKMQTNATKLFQNNSRPSGVLTAPGSISDETATRLKTAWQTNYGGDNYGKVAVLGDDLKFQPMSMTAHDAQMIEQMKWTAEIVCSTFHVPAFKIGLGQMPTYQNGELFNQIYYSDCLQTLIENMEEALDEGLGLNESKEGRHLGVELDLDGLLRMDTATQTKTLIDAINGGLMTTDEARKRVDLAKIAGGDKIWRQQQYYSLEALDERDKNDPFAKPAPAPAANDDMTGDEIADALSEEEAIA